MSGIDARFVLSIWKRRKIEGIAMPFVPCVTCGRHIRPRSFGHTVGDEAAINKEVDMDAIPGRSLVDGPACDARVGGRFSPAAIKGGEGGEVEDQSEHGNQ